MSVAILHLTDSHIFEDADPILGRGGHIASSVKRHLVGSSKLIVIFSGDIAQSGQPFEYQLAERFLTSLKNAILSELPRLTIDFVFAPGNHDCDFSEPDEVRDVIVGQVESKSPAIPQKFIDLCTSCQENYFEFRERWSNSLVKINDDKLWTTYDIEINGKHIYIDVLNGSWMSSRHEKQGGLLYPFERYASYESSEADLRVGVLHHPYGWYSQRNQGKFRAFMQGLSDIIFTGHEHDGKASVTDDLIRGECAYIEGAALYERSSGASGFNIVVLDLLGQRFQYAVYEWREPRYEPRQDGEWMDYRQMPKRSPGELDFSPAYQRQLSDLGATLRHPSGQDLVLEDIYVYPDLDARDDREQRRRGASKISSRTLQGLPSKNESVLVEGVENAGKTRLLYQLASNYHLQGYLPVYINGASMRSGPTDANVDALIRSAIAGQYGPIAEESFAQAPRAKKVLLLDDFDRSRLRQEHRSSMFQKLAERFASHIVTVSDDFEYTELFNQGESRSFVDFTAYRIAPFGHQRRRELIRKWMTLGATEETPKNELLQMEDDAAKLIDSARLQHVASTVPIFILSLLQGSASGLSKELQNSSFANYYHFLIVGAFERAHVPPNAMQKFIAACTHLSWFVKVNGSEQRITYQQFKQFVENYSTLWTATEATELCNVLTTARILVREDDNLSFAYPYAYYYFLGRHASFSLDSPDIQEYLRFCMENLYVRECANTLLFLAHHTGTSTVLDHLVDGIQRHFDDFHPATLSREDVSKVAKLISGAPGMVFRDSQPDDYRNEQERWHDENDNGDDGLKDQPAPPAEKKSVVDQLVSLTKSMEIAGALLSHQYANYTRSKKEAAIAAIFDSAMRAVRRFYAYFEEHDSEELIKRSAARLSEGKDSSSRDKAEEDLRQAVGWLIRAITTGLILRAGSSLTASELADNVDAVVGLAPSNANRLIRISQSLSKPTALPRVEIDSLMKSESENPCVMGVLQSLVLHRLYMYETRITDKDWAMSVFKLGGHATEFELRHRKPPALSK